MSDEAPRDLPLPAVAGVPAAAGGCPSTEQLLALQALPPEQMPADVVTHLARCERCQRLALFGPPRARRAKAAPTLGQALLRVAIVVVALAMALLSIKILFG